MLLCAIDPGLRHCSWSVFSNATGQLLGAGLVKNPTKTGGGPEAWRSMAAELYAHVKARHGLVGQLVLEGQQIYQVGHRAGKIGADPNDLLELAGVCGALCVVFEVAEASRVMPRQWKGTTDKTICQLRVTKRLSDLESVAISWPGRAGKDSALAHNVYDAIGIGLWAVGRWSTSP